MRDTTTCRQSNTVLSRIFIYGLCISNLVPIPRPLPSIRNLRCQRRNPELTPDTMPHQDQGGTKQPHIKFERDFQTRETLEKEEKAEKEKKFKETIESLRADAEALEKVKKDSRK